MKRFYVGWFFFSAGWGYLMAQPFADVPPRPAADIPLAFLSGAITAALLLGIEAWRARPGKLPAPRIELKPWHMPTGLMQFVFVTFTFSGLWGVLLGTLLTTGDVKEPLFVLMMSLGGLAGMLGIYRGFQSRFAA
jgi:hypothetical protein